MQKKITSFSYAGITARLAAILYLLLLPFLGRAQTAGSYAFTQSSGTYTPITGGTVLSSTIPDSWQSGAIALNPPFFFCGNFYSTAFVTSNGLISLGGTAGPGTTQYNGIANNGSGSGINLCPFNSDQVGSTLTGAVPEIRYQFVNNEHVFQWKDISRWTSGTDRISYQARLNVITGAITYVYSVTTVGTSTSYQPIVGIRTASTAGNWQSRTVANNATSSWAASTLSTVTTDACRFTSTSTNPKQPTTGQTYVYTPSTPPPSCSSLTFPTTSGTVGAPTTICMSGSVALSLNAAMPTGGTGIRYVWQRSATNAAPWTTMDTTFSPTYTSPVISASTYMRCLVLCNTTTVLTASAVQITVNNPGTPVVTNGQRCGPGTVTLSATPPSGSTVNWYAAPTGGAPLVTGSNTFSTGYLPATTTFYAAAASGTSPGSAWVGNGTSFTSSQPHPFYPTYMANKAQFLVKASELIALGLGAGTVNSISFDVGTVTAATNPTNIGDTVFNLSISVKPTTLNDLTTTFETGFGTPVYTNAAYRMQANTINTFAFGTPFAWDGSSNVIVEVCFSGPAWGGTKDVKYTTGLGFQASHYQHDDNAPNQCSTPTGFTNSTSTSRPNMRFDMTLGCTGPRQPVVATINSSPVVARTSPAVVCGDAVGTISLTPPATPYPSYNWSSQPGDNLYTNAAGTTLYTGGSATTIYMRSPLAGQHTYYMMAGNPTITTGCTFADTIRIWVQPDSIRIAGQPDTICVSGSTTLSLVPNADYYAGSIQWQTSTNGTTYTDITGANGVSYTTPTLNFGQNTYYRTLIKAGSATCEMPVKYVVVANPTIVSVHDSFNCGPGTVTLNAITGGNGSAIWYENASGGFPIAAGSPFVTPFLGTTTTYYVSSGGGGSAGTPPVGAGALTSSTQGVTPFSAGWGGSKHQYLIRASELLAAGVPPGAKLTSLGMDVVSGGTMYPGLAISMKHTAATVMTATYETGLTEVRAPANYTTAAGINTLVFTTPFTWNGTSNIVIQTCWSNGVGIYTATGSTVKYDNTSYVATKHGQSDNITSANMCSVVTPGTTSTLSQRPRFFVGYDNRCESPRQAITAYIRPVPVVDLGNDINQCVDEGTAIVLDAGTQPNNGQYLWDNGSNIQVRSVSQSGVYTVKVTNEYTCADIDTINVILRNNPEVELGNDTTVCNGVSLPLDAGSDGIEYFWSTGQTNQVINVTNPGSYNVFVTNSQGCTTADTIFVNMQGQLPTTQGIMVNNNGQYTFQFTALNPQNVIGYDWDFGDGSPHSYQAAPIHTYAAGGNYIVTLNLSSTCGFAAVTSAAHIVSVNQLNVDNNELSVYPNPTRSTATIVNRGQLKMERIAVYNILGQAVYSAAADSKDKHELKLDGLASGMYTIQVMTDKGNVARKLEIIR